MPYVKRDSSGQLMAISQEPLEGFGEYLDSDASELTAFVGKQGIGSQLDNTDQDFVRVLEDLITLLTDKGVILFTELPQSAQDKMLQRQQLRSELSSELNLIGAD